LDVNLREGVLEAIAEGDEAVVGADDPKGEEEGDTTDDKQKNEGYTHGKGLG
jgi:hypothetical protein